jgi:hypothetical protein
MVHSESFLENNISVTNEFSVSDVGNSASDTPWVPDLDCGIFKDGDEFLHRLNNSAWCYGSSDASLASPGGLCSYLVMVAIFAVGLTL